MKNHKNPSSLVNSASLAILCLSLNLMINSGYSQNTKSIDQITANSEAVRVAGGFRFTEGPAANAEGHIYFSDIPNNKTHKFNVLTGELTTTRQDSQGGNGIRIDKDGVIYTCEHGGRRISATLPDGKVITVVDSYNGKKLNSPNDLWIDPKGGIYFTDPRYGNADNLEQDGFHVYYKFAGSKRVIRVCDDLVKPNGIIGTPDGRVLYVADLGDNKTYKYDVQPNGTLSNKKLFAERGSDGMTMDSLGNVYLTRGAVHVYSSAGEYLGEIKSAESPANVTFGGTDKKTLFITARKGLYAIRMKVTGQ